MSANENIRALFEEEPINHDGWNELVNRRRETIERRQVQQEARIWMQIGAIRREREDREDLNG